MSNPTNFNSWFFDVTGDEPFDFQVQLATQAELPEVVKIPTGCGKTAMIMLGWLWRRIVSEDSELKQNTPRRLVYCLPMRVLVEQTRDVIKEWLEKLELSKKVKVHILMGGEESEDWDMCPERDAILIGTQDMLLSRALNRGYGMSRFRWPMHFGLLNNDCLWVYDEVQLMDVGVATSAQLEAFRESMKTSKSVHSIWMSATLEQDWLTTVDFDTQGLGDPLKLTDADLRIKTLEARYKAPKTLEKSEAMMGQDKEIAHSILGAHEAKTRTLAVFNTVDRARDVYKQLKKEQTDAQLVLIHSRFRPCERAEKIEMLLKEPEGEGTIIISTQVVEAGVDVSAKTMFTELAPWSSLVQRFGRCNRKGEDEDAKIYWFDIDDSAFNKLAKPYDPEELKKARDSLVNCDNASPASLEEVEAEMRLEPAHVIRRRDLIDLFDTTPDLAGNDIDISRFIRSGEDLDVQVFWREITSETERSNITSHREELCSVPFYDLKKFKQQVYRWDALESQWVPARQEEIYPGQTYLIAHDAGGYDPELGWDSSSKKEVEPKPKEDAKPDGYDRDQWSAASWQNIAEHTEEVVATLQEILDEMELDDDICGFLLQAARWHDRGKAHEVFQNAIREETTGNNDEKGEPRPPKWRERRDIAKAPRKPNFWDDGYDRKHFRHELASALAMLQNELPDLAAYLVAAHHGKVRLSIRSMPNENTPDDPSTLFARGIWDGDELPGVDLGGGTEAPSVKLSLQCMQLGRNPKDGSPSWAERMLKLRDRYGPFYLAYLEALMRAADMRASKESERAARQEEANNESNA